MVLTLHGKKKRRRVTTVKSLRESINMIELMQRINRIQAAQQDGSLANLTREPSYKCQKCRDEGGYVERGSDGYEVYRECECWKSAKTERMFKSSRITFEFQTKTFDNFDIGGRPTAVQGAYHCARAYLETFEQVRKERQNSIALLGRPGCGKTHLLMAVSNELIRQGSQVLYFPWVEGFNEIKDDLSLCEERINRMQKVDVLYIDDMWKGRKDSRTGKMAPTPFQVEQIFAVINYRYMEKLPVLISSEMDIDDMCDIDEAIGSRINEMCRDFRVVLKGGKDLNYRLREDVS